MRSGAALCVLLLACAPSAKIDEKKAEPTKLESAPLPPPQAAPGPPPFRGPILSLHKKEARSAGVIAPGKRAAPAQLAVLEDGDLLNLDFGCGARAQVSGPAIVAVSGRSDQGLLVRQGLLRVELPPGAAKPGAACWLASPALRMELPRAARFALRVHEDGRTQIAVVSGRVTVATGTLSAEEDSGTQALEAGRLLEANLTSATTPRVVTGPSTLEAALSLLAAKARAARTVTAKQLSDSLENRLLPGLKAQIGRAASQLERARTLDQQHRLLVSARDPQAMVVQRQIAEQAAHTFVARRSLDAALSRVEAARLNATEVPAPAPMSASSIEPMLSRASELLR